MAGGDREKALDAALANIEKQFGKGSVMRLGDEIRAPLEVIPTGSIALDVALGLGGLPRGRVVEIYGPESSGKTTVALHAVANAQRAGGIVAFIDAEHALDPDYAKALGVDTDALLVSQPDSGEQALEIADMLIRSGALDLIVIDSVAALVPRAEIEGEMGDSHVGLQARLMSQALRKMTGALNNSGTTMIFINQLREKIGVMFGSPETTTGGKALKFYSSVRLDVRRIETLKDGTDMVGNRTRVKVVKNKVAPPFKQAEFDIMYGKGISREGGLIDVGVEAGLVRKAGAWYTYEGDQLGQGKENSRTFLKDNPDLANELEKKILEKLGVGPHRRRRRPTTSRTSRSASMTSDRAVAPDSRSEARARASYARDVGSRTGRRRRGRVTSTPGSRPGPGRRGSRRPGRRRTTIRASRSSGCRRVGARSGRPARANAGRPDARPVPGPPPDEVAEGPDADPEAVARKILLDQLTGQARSRKELADKLAKKNVPDELADPPARPVRGGRPGRRRGVRPGLGRSPPARARGWPAGRWPRSCAARASTTRSPARRSTRSTPPTRRPAARALVRKKLRSLRGSTSRRPTRRLVGMLARKGYGSGLAFAVVKDELKLDADEHEWMQELRRGVLGLGLMPDLSACLCRAVSSPERPACSVPPPSPTRARGAASSMTMRLTIADRGHELSGVVRDGESWRAAAVRTAGSLMANRCRSTCPARSSSSSSTTTGS